jgi:hypothetical protein
LPRGPQERVPALIRFEALLGKGLWHYRWSEGRLPHEVVGYKLVSSPVEGTMAGWARPVVFESVKMGTRVSVRCFKDYAGVKITKPWIDPDWPPRWLESVEFHGLKAGMIATVPTGFAPLPPGTRPAAGTGFTPTPDVPLKFDEDRKVDFVFRLGDDVFGVHAEKQGIPRERLDGRQRNRRGRVSLSAASKAWGQMKPTVCGPAATARRTETPGDQLLQVHKWQTDKLSRWSALQSY